jgi:Ca2+-binding EF-hand superfamily protein
MDSTRTTARRQKALGTDLMGRIRDKVAQTEKISKVFRKFDVDRDGRVDHEEFKNGLRGMGFLVSKKECNRLLKEVDKDNSGEVDYREFCKTMIDEAYEKDHDAVDSNSMLRQ